MGRWWRLAGALGRKVWSAGHRACRANIHYNKALGAVAYAVTAG